jgi:hypothetical protein
VPAEAREGELTAEMKKALAALDEKYRLAVALCHQEGLTKREVGAILDMPESTVSKYVSVGLERLRDALRRAGYAVAPAAIIGGLAHTAPPVPATLAAGVAKLIAGSTVVKATGTGAAGKSAVLKGGLIVKIGLGVAAAGLVAGGVFWAAGGKSEETAKPPAKVEKPRKFATPVTDPGAEWERDGNFAGCGLMGYLDGPREGMLTADSVGLYNWFGEGADNRMRTYDPATERYYTVAGTTHGYLDGPFSRARFALNGPNSSYVSSVSATASPDGRYLYLSEGRLGVLRRLDFEKKEVTTLSRDKNASGSMAADSKGNLYIFGWGGCSKMLPDGR